MIFPVVPVPRSSCWASSSRCALAQSKSSGFLLSCATKAIRLRAATVIKDMVQTPRGMGLNQ